MQKSILMRGLLLLTGLCLTLPLFQTSQLRAEELKPFLTLKIADPETLMSVAGKIADLSGQKRDFDAGVASFKDLSGLNRKGPFGLVLQSDGEEIKEPIFILPIEKLEDVDLPNFEVLMAAAQKDGEGKYTLNSPMGVYNMYQKKGFVLITTADSQGRLPEDPAKLFAGLENFTVGFRVDFENTSLDSIEMLLAPVNMILAMQGGQAAQSAEQLSEAIEMLHKEYRSVTGGVVFDPKTAALDFVGTYLPKKDSDTAKVLDAFKDMKTAFSGFSTDGPSKVFSISGIESNTQGNIETTMASIDQIIDGLLEQVDEQAESDAEYELAEKVAKSFRKIVEGTLKKGKSDFGASLDADGTLLVATTIGETDELKKLAVDLFEHVKSMHEAAEVDAFMKENYKKGFSTVENFKLSSLFVPLAAVKAHDIPDSLADKTIAIYWGVKENEAIALAVGLDVQETEKKFLEALGKTQSAVPVKQPLGTFSVQAFGKLLDRYVPNEMRDETAKKVIAVLAGATSDAKITITSYVADEKLEVKVSSTGSVASALAKLIKIFAAADDENSDRTQIRDF